MPWFCSQSKRGSEERFRTSLYRSLHYRQKDAVPSSASSSSSLPQPAPPAPVGSSGSKINPVVLFIIVILAVIFFVSGLLHLLIRFLMKQKQPASASSPQSNTGYQRDISGSEALQRQLQQLFHLHDSGLDQSFIDALPIFLYKEIVGTKEQFDCAVCLCEFDDEDKLRLLPMCSHAFHLSCIDTWLLSNSTCPLCRGNLFIPGLAIENPVFDFNDDDGNLEDGSSLSLPALNQKAGDLDDEEEGSGCVVGKKKVFPVRLGKFKSVHSSNNPGGLVINNNDNSNMRREEGESSSSNLDARRCFSMGSYQYVVGDSVLQVALKKGKKGDEKTGGGSSRRRDPLPGLHAEGLLGKRLGVVGKGESFSVSKIWQWSSTSSNNNRGKFPIVSADTSSLDDGGRRNLPWI